MCPLPCGGIFFYAPTLQRTFLVSAGLVVLSCIVVPFFFGVIGAVNFICALYILVVKKGKK